VADNFLFFSDILKVVQEDSHSVISFSRAVILLTVVYCPDIEQLYIITW